MALNLNRKEEESRISSPQVSPKLRLYRNDSVEFEGAPPLLEIRPPTIVSLGDFIYPDVVSRQACFWGGLVFSLIGAIEFFFPQLVRDTANHFHSLFYLVAGALLIGPALTLGPKTLNRFAAGFGVVLAVFGFLGFFVSAPEASERFLWVISPGVLEFGTKDHILQEVVGLTLVLVSFRNRRNDRVS